MMDILAQLANDFIAPFQADDWWQRPLVKYYISAVLAAYPVWRIYQRAGIGTRGVFWLVVPFGGFILTTAHLAFKRWPQTTKGDA